MLNMLWLSGALVLWGPMCWCDLREYQMVNFSSWEHPTQDCCHQGCVSGTNSSWFQCHCHHHRTNQEHCYCDTCVNYRPVNLIKGGKVRTDRRWSWWWSWWWWRSWWYSSWSTWRSWWYGQVWLRIPSWGRLTIRVWRVKWQPLLLCPWVSTSL